MAERECVELNQQDYAEKCMRNNWQMLAAFRASIVAQLKLIIDHNTRDRFVLRDVRLFFPMRQQNGAAANS